MQIIRTQGGGIVNPAQCVEIRIQVPIQGCVRIIALIPGDEILLAAFATRIEADEALARIYNKLSQGHSVDFLWSPATVTATVSGASPWEPGEEKRGIFKRRPNLGPDVFADNPINDDSPVVTQLGVSRVSDAVPGEEEGQ